MARTEEGMQNTHLQPHNIEQPELFDGVPGDEGATTPDVTTEQTVLDASNGTSINPATSEAPVRPDNTPAESANSSHSKALLAGGALVAAGTILGVSLAGGGDGSSADKETVEAEDPSGGSFGEDLGEPSETIITVEQPEDNVDESRRNTSEADGQLEPHEVELIREKPGLRYDDLIEVTFRNFSAITSNVMETSEDESEIMNLVTTENAFNTRTMLSNMSERRRLREEPGVPIKYVWRLDEIVDTPLRPSEFPNRWEGRVRFTVERPEGPLEQEASFAFELRDSGEQGEQIWLLDMVYDAIVINDTPQE